MTPGHVLVAAFVLGALCSCATNPARQEQPTAHGAKALRTRLIEDRWMLFSSVYPVMPTEGYPIEFEANGHVQTRNLPLIVTWRLTKDLTLQFASSEQVSSMALPYDSQAGVFVSQPEVEPTFLVGPRGFHFDRYFNELPAHGDPAS